MNLQVLGEMGDTLAEDGNLDLGDPVSVS